MSTMFSVFYLILSFFVGAAIGLFYFGVLWFTLLYLSKTKRPVLVVMVSLIVRMVVTLLGFYLVMGGRWEKLLIALGGFILARIVLSRRLRVRGKTPLIK